MNLDRAVVRSSGDRRVSPEVRRWLGSTDRVDRGDAEYVTGVLQRREARFRAASDRAWMGATIGVAILVGGIALGDPILTALGGIGSVVPLLLAVMADGWARDSDALLDEVAHRQASDAKVEAQPVVSVGRWVLLRKGDPGGGRST